MSHFNFIFILCSDIKKYGQYIKIIPSMVYIKMMDIFCTMGIVIDDAIMGTSLFILHILKGRHKTPRKHIILSINE